MAGQNVLQLNDGNFDKTMGEIEVPVLVDFWAPWCGPCRAIGPIVEALANDYEGQAAVAKVNVDESPEIAGRYGITSIPAVYVFHKGQIVETSIGAKPRPALERMLKNHIPA